MERLPRVRGTMAKIRRLANLKLKGNHRCEAASLGPLSGLASICRSLVLRKCTYVYCQFSQGLSTTSKTTSRCRRECTEAIGVAQVDQARYRRFFWLIYDNCRWQPTTNFVDWGHEPTIQLSAATDYRRIGAAPCALGAGSEHRPRGA